MELISDTDPRLRAKCEPLNFRNPGFDLDQTLLDMFALIREHDGIGLAAPQIGITKRFFILQHNGERFICINPKVLKASKELQTGDEGCLSYPGMTLQITRPLIIRASYTQAKGIVRKHSFHGLLARAFLHELDHLNGLVLPDYQHKEIPGNVSNKRRGQSI